MSRAEHHVPFVESVFHPTDFSATSERAFEHALAVALRDDASLTLLHSGKGDRSAERAEFPSVRATLERWGIGGERHVRGAATGDRSVRVKKVSLRGRRPLTAVLEYLDEHPTDLIVLATEGREGLPRWFRPSMAEAIARYSKTMTLFVPNSARGFVSNDNGNISIRRILVPVDRSPSPRAAVVVASRVSGVSEVPPVEAVLFHVGPEEDVLPTDPPRIASCQWSVRRAEGDVVGEILRASEEQDADLIVMATGGQNGVLDALRGTVTEQVVRGARCPVLAVPARLLLV